MTFVGSGYSQRMFVLPKSFQPTTEIQWQLNNYVCLKIQSDGLVNSTGGTLSLDGLYFSTQ